MVVLVETPALPFRKNDHIFLHWDMLVPRRVYIRIYIYVRFEIYIYYANISFHLIFFPDFRGENSLSSCKRKTGLHHESDEKHVGKDAQYC